MNTNGGQNGGPRFRLSQQAISTLLQRAEAAGQDPSAWLEALVLGAGGSTATPSEGDASPARTNAPPQDLKRLHDEEAREDAAEEDGKISEATTTNPLRKWAQSESTPRADGDAKQKKVVAAQRRVAPQGRQQR